MERIGRFKERYKVGNLYTINVKQADGKVTDIVIHLYSKPPAMLV